LQACRFPHTERPILGRMPEAPVRQADAARRKRP
jgi:hypothetical protein